MNKLLENEIERLVSKYLSADRQDPWPDSKGLFRIELQYLVTLAEREQIKKDREMLNLKKEVKQK